MREHYKTLVITGKPLSASHHSGAFKFLLDMEEIWKDIKGYEGYYKISNRGNVLSLRKNKILIPYSDKNGYLRITLKLNKKKKFVGIHRLVAFEFISNPENKSQVNHIDFNPKNNNDINLEWVTDKENKEHSLKNGRKNGRKKGCKILKRIMPE